MCSVLNLTCQTCSDPEVEAATLEEVCWLDIHGKQELTHLTPGVTQCGFGEHGGMCPPSPAAGRPGVVGGEAVAGEVACSYLVLGLEN